MGNVFKGKHSAKLETQNNILYYISHIAEMNQKYMSIPESLSIKAETPLMRKHWTTG